MSGAVQACGFGIEFIVRFRTESPNPPASPLGLQTPPLRLLGLIKRDQSWLMRDGGCLEVAIEGTRTRKFEPELTLGVSMGPAALGVGTTLPSFFRRGQRKHTPHTSCPIVFVLVLLLKGRVQCIKHPFYLFHPDLAVSIHDHPESAQSVPSRHCCIMGCVVELREAHFVNTEK